jgi:hypothetical protein
VPVHAVSEQQDTRKKTPAQQERWESQVRDGRVGQGAMAVSGTVGLACGCWSQHQPDTRSDRATRAVLGPSPGSGSAQLPLLCRNAAHYAPASNVARVAPPRADCDAHCGHSATVRNIAVRAAQVRNISASDVAGMASEGWVVLDVRPPNEVEKAPVSGAVRCAGHDGVAGGVVWGGLVAAASPPRDCCCARLVTLLGRAMHPGGRMVALAGHQASGLGGAGHHASSRQRGFLSSCE